MLLGVYSSTRFSDMYWGSAALEASVVPAAEPCLGAVEDMTVGDVERLSREGACEDRTRRVAVVVTTINER
jgi:hypothetical protein